MTGKDKVEDQLLTSIRKNKPAADTAPRKPATRPTTRKAAPGKTGTTRAQAKPQPKAQPVESETCQYQAGRRVWPD